MRIQCLPGRFKRTANAMGLGILLVSPLASQAEMLGYEYTSINGDLVTAEPEKKYANPQGGIKFYLRAGVDRKLMVDVHDAEGNTFATKTSDIIGAQDRIVWNGEESYGYEISLPKLDDGNYEVTSSILSSSGEVIDEDTHPLIIHRSIPTLGNVDITQSYLAAGNLADKWGKPVLSYNRVSDITLENVSSGIPIKEVTAYVRNSREKLSSANTSVSKGKARFDRTALPVLSSEEELILGFEAIDAAGNKAKKELPFYYDRGDGVDKHGRLQPIAIYDPSQYRGQTLPGGFKVNGYVPYSAGMTVSENPIYAIFKVKKENYEGYSPYGIGRLWGNSPRVGTDVVHEDRNFVYLRSDGHGKPNLLSYGNHTVRFRSYDQMLNVHYAEPMSFRLSSSALIGPTLKKTTLYLSDGTTLESAGPSVQRYLNLNQKDVTIDRVRVEVEPRPYRQRVYLVSNKSSNQSVYIDPGNTVGYASLGGINLYDIASAGDHLFFRLYHRVYGLDAGSAFGTANLAHLDVYIDIEPPVIERVAYEINNSEVVVSTYETAEKYYGDHAHYTHYYSSFENSTAEMRKPNSTWHPLTHSKEILDSHWDRKFKFGTAAVPEGIYSEIRARVQDRFGNTTTKEVKGEFVVDRTYPEVRIISGDDVRTLDEILIILDDNLDDSPGIINAKIRGGPAGDDVNLATVSDKDVKNGYRLEYPIMFPSLNSGEKYDLTITAQDASGNVTDQTITFVYDPPRVDLAYGDGFVAMLPAISQPFYRPSGARIIESKPLQLRDGSLVVGRYQLIATLRSDAEVPLIINGHRLDPGDTVVLDEQYDFGVNNSQISVSAYPAEDGLIGTSSLLLSTSAPNAPVLLTNITTWLPSSSVSRALREASSTSVPLTSNSNRRTKSRG